MPESPESPEEIFQGVISLEKEGLVEAHVIRDVKSNAKGIEVRYVTLAGTIQIESKRSKTREASSARLSSAGAAHSVLRR